ARTNSCASRSMHAMNSIRRHTKSSAGLPSRATRRRRPHEDAARRCVAAPRDRARAEMLVADARQAVKDEAPLDRVQSLTSELQQVLYGLQPAPAGGGNGQQGPSGNGHGSPVDDDVVDAEFDRS